MKPLRNIVFIKSDEQRGETKAGLILPENASDKPIKGTIEAAGSECKEVKVGDRVLFKKYGPDEVELDEGTFMVGDETDILAIL